MSDNTIPPFNSRVSELDERVRARDITWLRQHHARGELAWLAPYLGQADYRDFGTAIDAGDIDLVSRRIAVLGDSTKPITGAGIAATFVAPDAPLTGVAGDLRTTDLDDPTLLVSRRGAILPASAVRRERNTLVVLGILLAVTAAAIVAFLLLRNNNKNSDSTDLAADTTLATDTVANDSVMDTVIDTIGASPVTPASSSLPGASVAAATLVPSSAPATVRPASASNVAPQVPNATTPLDDAITTAGRSATFAPYLAMIEAAGLSNELRNMKNVTFLAPTESAFTPLPPDVQIALRSPANRAVLARIVRFSLLTQTRTAAQLTPGNYPTAEGTPVRVQSLNGAIRINDATITGSDVKVASGVLHAIDRLLIPPSVDLNTIIPKLGAVTPTPTTPLTTLAPTPSTTPATAATAATTAAPATTPQTVVTATTAAPTSPASTAPATTSAPTTIAATTAAPTTRSPTTTIA